MWATDIFCNEEELISEISKHKPKKLCFSNGINIKTYDVHCKIQTKLHLRPKFFEVNHLLKIIFYKKIKPTSLQSQFTSLTVDEDGWRPPKIYGSDFNHRYCPMIKVKMNIFL